MDVDLLRTFVAAARARNLRRAAEDLFLSPSAVTVQIHRLEREAGCQLFARGARGVRLTPAGWWLLPRAEAALAQLDAARQGLLAFREGVAQRVALAVSPFVARTTLPYALAHLRAERPELDYAVDVVQSVDIAAAVSQGRADLGLSLLPAPRGGPVTAERLWSEPVVLVVSAGPMEEAEGGDWRHVVSRQRLLTHSHPAFWEDLLGSLRHMGILGRTMPVTDMDITRRFIGEGLGVSFLPTSVVWEELATGRMVAIQTDGLTAPTSEVFALRAAGAANEGGEALVAMLRRLRG